MTPNISIVDYGSGNLLSVQRALEHVGAKVHLVDTPEGVLSADRLVLPGVGAFADGMNSLRAAGLADALQSFAATGRPLLGICLGMQMFATCSEEFGVHEGLDLIPGRVVPIPPVDVGGGPLKRPHIGWADLLPAESSHATFPLEPGKAVYLVHSFHFEPDQNEARLADCIYGGRRIVAAVRSENVTGFQFHPEKSGAVGLRMLEAFVSS